MSQISQSKKLLIYGCTITLNGKSFYSHIPSLLYDVWYLLSLHVAQNFKWSFVGWNRGCLHNMSHIDGPAKGSIDQWKLKNLFQFPQPLIQYRTEFYGCFLYSTVVE